MKAVHLLTDISDHRETRSIIEIKQIVEQAGIGYVQSINAIPTEEPPTPRECNDRPFTLTKAHYGCYTAHKNAIREYLGTDGLWIFECDTVFTVDYEEAVKRMHRVAEVCAAHQEIVAFTLGYRHNGQGISRPEPDILTINQWIETHAYYVPWSSKPIMDAIFAEPWDALDYTYTIRLCDQTGAQIGIFADRPIAVQGIGVSLIDHKLKGSEPHFRNVRYHASQNWKA